MKKSKISQPVTNIEDAVWNIVEALRRSCLCFHITNLRTLEFEANDTSISFEVETSEGKFLATVERR